MAGAALMGIERDEDNPMAGNQASQQEAVVGTPVSFDVETPRRKPTFWEMVRMAFCLAAVICGGYQLLSAALFGHMRFSPHLYGYHPVVSMSYHPDWFIEGIVVYALGMLLFGWLLRVELRARRFPDFSRRK